MVCRRFRLVVRQFTEVPTSVGKIIQSGSIPDNLKLAGVRDGQLKFRASIFNLMVIPSLSNRRLRITGRRIALYQKLARRAPINLISLSRVRVIEATTAFVRTGPPKLDIDI